jgi:hypothetical protein
MIEPPRQKLGIEKIFKEGEIRAATYSDAFSLDKVKNNFSSDG